MKVRFDSPRGYRPIEEGWYLAELISVRPETTRYGKSYEFKFSILEEDHRGRTIGKFLKPAKMMVRWIKTLKKMDEDVVLSEYDLSELAGCACRVYIETTGENRNRIVDIEGE